MIPPAANAGFVAQIELNVLIAQCLNRRIGEIEEVRGEVASWESERNGRESTVNWRFTTDDARIKLKRLYPMLDT